MTRTIVGVLRGGTSNEYPLSLKTGAAMINALPEEQYEIRDILIDKSGMWHLRGVPSTPGPGAPQSRGGLWGPPGGGGGGRRRRHNTSLTRPYRRAVRGIERARFRDLAQQDSRSRVTATLRCPHASCHFFHVAKRPQHSRYG